MKQKFKVLSPELFNEGGNDWKDFYLEIKDLKKGEIFYESDNRNAINYELKAVEDAKKINNAWICKVEKLSGEIVEIYVSATTESSSFVGPNLFRAPQVLSFVEGRGYAYQIC